MEKSMDILKKNMIELGATKTMTESKTVELVLLALSGPEEVERIKKELNLLEQAKEFERFVQHKVWSAENVMREAKEEQRIAREAEARLNEKIEEFKNAVKIFKETVSAMETPEARDKVRLSEYYKLKKEEEKEEDTVPAWERRTYKRAGRRL